MQIFLGADFYFEFGRVDAQLGKIADARMLNALASYWTVHFNNAREEVGQRGVA